MTPTTGGTYRVLSAVRDAPALRCVPLDGEAAAAADSGGPAADDDGEREPPEPVRVRTDGYEGDLADRVAGLRLGYVVDATLSWADGEARFESVAVRDDTLFAFVEGVSGLFEAALDTWEEARREGVGVNSRPTFSTDGEPNGAVYTFAEQSGERDVFAELREGTLPLEPLVARLDDREDCPHEVFVMRPAAHDFVLVYCVLRKESVLANTVRDTYDCPRPSEPLVDGESLDSPARSP